MLDSPSYDTMQGYTVRNGSTWIVSSGIHKGKANAPSKVDHKLTRNSQSTRSIVSVAKWHRSERGEREERGHYSEVGRRFRMVQCGHTVERGNAAFLPSLPMCLSLSLSCDLLYRLIPAPLHRRIHAHPPNTHALYLPSPPYTFPTHPTSSPPHHPVNGGSPPPGRRPARLAALQSVHVERPKDAPHRGDAHPRRDGDLHRVAQSSA